MRSKLFYCGVALILATIVWGCAGPIQDIACIKSENIKNIPTNVALYPILSTPIGRSTDYYGQGLKSMSSEAGVSAQIHGDNVVISPPAESDLRITEESKIMTASLSVQMAANGFSLSQLPVETFAESYDNPGVKSGSQFFITVDLLNSLHEKNNLNAILIGDVFFRNERHHGIIEKRITFAHLKVIDVTNLDILGQVFFPYNSEGVELNLATERIAAELADLAGLSDGDRAGR